MTSTVQLAVVPSADSPGTIVYFHHDKRSYLFGRVAEGTQRSFGSRKIHYSDTEHIFLSGPVGWDQMGGLLGYMLSLASTAESSTESITQDNVKKVQKGLKPSQRKGEHPGIVVHGGDNLSHVLAACRPNGPEASGLAHGPGLA
ncbi:hypothetical protein XA68_17774 [Ophiocordyceps unilateralis]|uniref:ribonuclease Z n=1 Tax=Ophiocordyceps unilateralis TaxID=268505 RepID=A0A2A9PRW0_OPHUN|nr:hypothetical protein XA68_17774 [Ophiocordyceps unilateralis]